MHTRRHNLLTCLLAYFLFFGCAWVFLQPPSSSAPLEELIRTNLTGRMIEKEGLVEYLHPQQPPVFAPTNQYLDFGDALRTLDLSRATVRLINWSHFRVKDRSRLEIVRRPDDTNSPGIRLLDGQIYFSNRGTGPRAVPIETPHVRGVPKGTEFLIAVDLQAQRTEVTMFDGEVELQSPADPQPVPVRSGFQGIAVPGQPTQVRPLLQAQNIVQWWLYYPGLLDPAESGLTPDEQTQLAASLTAYRDGDLQHALQQFPGYPAPPNPATDAQRLYLAGLLLAVGALDRAEALLAKADSNAPPACALRTMIDAVRPVVGADTKSESRNPKSDLTASELLAISYAYQSSNNLTAALAAARAAINHSADFGFGWARVAELEFSLGHTGPARDAVARALRVTPRNAQAHALNGFLLAAEYRFREAIASFDEAIRIDPALGNAWLGRGLCKRRLGILSLSQLSTDGGDQSLWLSDLQTAAILESTRSLTRAYTGKAFSEVGDFRLACKEFEFAKQLDPNDPTPWLYSALENWQQNRVNKSVRELERSMDLNDNRAVYRSRLLLDQDHAVRSASLAKIYQSAGLDDVSLREASKAVSYDYASHSAHQFLAESYNSLREPARFNLRYETVWFNELLLANLLSPVGAGLLSQNISQQEYSGLFEANRLGLLTTTEYRSDHQFREIASQYGLLGRTSYTLDLDYQHNDGVRPNNKLNRIEWYSQFKHQLNDRDSVFLLTKYQDYESGDNFQHYDPANVSPKLRVTESQAPILLGAFHREWAPGSHTTLLAGRLESDVIVQESAAVLDLWTNSPPPGINWVRLQSFDSARVDTRFTAWLAELNQVWQGERYATVLGGRLQAGAFDVRSTIDNSTNAFVQSYYAPPISSAIDESFDRWSLYGYETFEPWNHFRLSVGLAYEWLAHPANFRFSPLIAARKEREALLPKVSLQWDAAPNLTLRGMYAQSLGGLSYDESVRLEPTQLAGFAQTFRNVISEAEAGSVVAPHYEVAGVALDTRFPSGTFVGLQAQWIRSDVDQSIGTFHSDGTSPPPPRAVPAATSEKLRYDEGSVGVYLNQLLGNEWSVGADYQLTHSRLRWSYPEIPSSLPLSPSRTESALLHRVRLSAQYQHPAGFFARAECNWFIQHNIGYGHTVYTAPRADDSINQINLFTGWRFARRRAELSFGCLNVANHDYRLNSLNPYPDLPRERVWLGRVRINF